VLYRAVLFTFAPTAVELCLVLALLSGAFSPLVAALVGLTFCFYVAWTLTITQLSVEVRKRVIALDNLATSKAVDALLNAETVALFDNAKLEVAQYDAYLTGYQKAAIENERLSALLNAGQAVILAAGLTGVLVAAIVVGGGGGAAAAATAATTASGGSGGGLSSAWSSFFAWAAATPAGAARFGASIGPGISGGDLVLLQGLLLQVWAPLSFLGWFWRELKSSLVDLEEFFDVLRTPSSLPDGARDLPAAAAAGDDWGLSVELRDVHFGYHPGREVLKGVSLRVNPGESVAIVGPSGSGKSSLLRLVTRLYDCSSRGSVLVGGVDVRDLKRSSLRAATAVVPQEAVLLNDSLLQNVRYGRPDATDEEVMAAIRAARLGAAVARMPEGAWTGVGERGLKLSGGEKQRVAIARAFLKAPRLLVCDEASSALDSATEVR
jgi:ABC-type transport system involved in Fe-S cluster assembly fused permease/ATPase subunit